MKSLENFQVVEFHFFQSLSNFVFVELMIRVITGGLAPSSQTVRILIENPLAHKASRKYNLSIAPIDLTNSQWESFTQEIGWLSVEICGCQIWLFLKLIKQTFLKFLGFQICAYCFASFSGFWTISNFVIFHKIKIPNCIWDQCCHLVAETGSWFIPIQMGLASHNSSKYLKSFDKLRS